MSTLTLALLFSPLFSSTPTSAQYTQPNPNPPASYTCWAGASDGSTYMAKGFDLNQTQNDALHWCVIARGEHGGCKPLGCS